MSEIEKIQRYIDRAKLNIPAKYGMSMVEGMELSKQAFDADNLPLEIIILAFNYGRTKGYRAAQAEARRGQAN